MHITSRLSLTLSMGALLVFGASALAQGMSDHDMAGHSMSGHKMAGHDMAMPSEAYKFELVGTPKALGAKQHVVSIRILQPMQGMADMPVSGASITKALLDMSPDNMPTMTAPATPVPSTAPGVYAFAFDNSVWADKGHWALVVTAKIKGEAKPITGKVIFQTGN